MASPSNASKQDIDLLRQTNVQLSLKIDDLHRELRECERRIAQMGRLKTQFLSVISYELRTPLHVILGFSEFLLDFEQLSDGQHMSVQRIHQSGKHLLGLISSILDLALIEEGDLVLDSRPFSVVDWFQRVTSEISRAAEEKQLQLITKCDERLPAYQCGDPKRLFDIAYGLLTNAVKYTDTGKVTVELRRVSTTLWLIEVADTGIGISQEQQAYIFDVFRQGDGSYTRRYGGLGVGLSLVRKLTTLMGGQVTFETQVGVGTVFRVLLPLHEASAADATCQ